MYVNKCTKCGKEFETKNPKRVICPDCLYPDRKPLLNDVMPQEGDVSPQNQQPTGDMPSGDMGERPPYQERQNRGYNNYQDRRPNNYGGYQDRRPNNYGGGYQDRRPNNNYGGGFRRPDGGYQDRRPNNYGGGYQDRRPNNNYGGGFRRPDGGYQDRRPNNYGGGYQDRRPNNNYGGGFRRPDGGYQNRRPNNYGGGFRRPYGNRPSPKQKKSLLISKEQVAQIEVLYKRMLPLPNYDAHEVIGAEIGLEPQKTFFGINLVRQKLNLPKLPYPKRKLAVSPEQLMAIQNLYKPLLPLPPIGCHKIIAAQLKMDEWRVHVGIGLVRKQLNLPRWNPDREDAPEEFKNQAQAASEEAKVDLQKETPAEEIKTEETPEAAVSEEKPKKTRAKKEKKQAE